MRWRGKQSLNRKLTLIVVAAVMAASLVIAVGSVWQEARRHTLNKLDYLNATAAVFASATSQAVAEGDRQSALFALRGVGHAPHMLFARVRDAHGVSIAEIGSGVSLASDARYGEGAGASASLWSALRSRTIEVSAPIKHAGLEVGRITLVSDNADLLPTLLATLFQTLLGALAALTVAVLVAARLQQWVVRPLLRLTETVSHISKSHDYAARVDIETDDEVGELCSGFNQMLAQIELRERKIIELASHDADTDLPNRLAFEREIAARLEAGKSGMLIVAAIGVDRFQYVRGVIGYQATNDLLGEVGARVISIGARASAARISTDVIGFLIEARDVESAHAFAAAVLAEVEAPMYLGADAIEVNLTVGIAARGVHADTPYALIERAHIALDQARAAHTKIASFDEAAYEETAQNLSLMNDLARALDNGQMAIHFQPKYDIRRKQVSGAEVLVRWTHPTRGRISPDIFITKAEETGLVGPLTEWVLRETLAAQARLAERGYTPTLAVNLSGRLVCDREFIAVALDLLKQATTPLYLEITETANMDDQELALEHIDALVAAGAKISIDDYGQGLSSLAYLKRIPAQELKIDKSFVQNIGEVQRDALLVKSTIDLAHSLGMQVTAEGVETESALRALAAMGCDRAQGYLIAKPMPEAEFTAFMGAATTPIAANA